MLNLVYLLIKTIGKRKPLSRAWPSLWLQFRDDRYSSNASSIRKCFPFTTKFSESALFYCLFRNIGFFIHKAHLFWKSSWNRVRWVTPVFHIGKAKLTKSQPFQIWKSQLALSSQYFERSSPGVLVIIQADQSHISGQSLCRASCLSLPGFR